MNNRDQFMLGEPMSRQQDSTTTSQQAKQTAMVKWLLIKANKDLEDYREIFQSVPSAVVTGKNFSCRLHPKIVNALQSAELYSAALVNMHVDHHFYNPDHNRILQVLARKGVILSDPQLTVSVLLKSDPINLTAHLSVIEAIMILYAKEVATPDRIFAAIEKFNTSQRFPNDLNSNSVIHQRNITDYDQLLLLWIGEAVSALNKRIIQESSFQKNDADVPENEKNRADYFRPPGRELTDLSDGIALCALVSFYCPQSLPWKKIRVGKPMNTADSLHNLSLFVSVCQLCLPYPVFHMNPQDMLSHSIGSMRPNIIALVADLFNLFEISPRVLPDNRSDALGYPPEFHAANNPAEQDSRTANSSPKADRKSKSNNISDNLSTNELFVVHKGRNIPTLSSVNPDNGLKEKYESVAAGKPTNWNDTRKTQMSGCGRRSRRNSFSDDSQLTIENFGGSHENLNLLGRNPDKEFAVHVVNPSTEELSENDVGRQHRIQVAAQENWSSAGVTSLLCDNTVGNSTSVKPYHNASESTTAVATVAPGPVMVSGLSVETTEMLESCKLSSQMLDIRLKLEKKRQQIEREKRQMEENLKKQRRKLNKAAFLQAVSKIEVENVNGNGGGCEGASGDGNYDSNDSDSGDIDHDSIVTYEDISQVEQRWLKDGGMDKNVNGDASPKFDGPTSDSDNIDIEKCQKSISEMDSSLHAIQTDLQWLDLKANEMLHNPAPEQHNPELPKSYPVSFMLNQGSHQASQNQLLHRMMSTGQQNQNNDFYSNSVDYANENRGNFVNIPNKNFAEFNYGDSVAAAYAQHNNLHHHSLIPTVPMKSPLPASSPLMVQPFDHVNCAPDNIYMYQQQRPPMLLQSHTSPNFNHNNYRSMNIQNACVSDDKENQMHVHQARNEQFYLHKPSESPQFPFQSPSATLANLNYSTSPGSAATFNQRKTWDSREHSASVSPQPTPPPRMYTSRYLLNKDPMTLTKTFADNKLKSASPTSKFSDEHNASSRVDSPTMYPSGLNPAKKSFSSIHDSGGALDVNHSNHYASETDSAPRQLSAGCMSIPTPSVDDMAPQCISFIGSEHPNTNEDTVDKAAREDQFSDSVNKLNIINGNRTYRIPSPTNKPHFRPSSHHPFINDDTSKSEKGFYVSFSNDDDNENDNAKRFSQRMKAPLRMKRTLNSANSISSARNEKFKTNAAKFKPEVGKKPETIYNDRDRSGENHSEERLADSGDNSCDRILEKANDDTIIIKSKKSGSVSSSSVGLLINADVNSNDPAAVDEMERKKERILLQSLQRRQQQEEMKARKEIELQRRKEQEKQKEDQKAMKKEQEKQRRAAILEKHRLKKMIEEAEREGKPIDKELLNALNKTKSNSVNGDGSGRGNAPLPKLRARKQPFATRPRPKTIHIDVGSNFKDTAAESNLLTSNFSKKGSSVNLAEHNNNYGMSRRDYYRGSQDCLLAGAEMGNTAGTSASSIYSDLTDEDRAVSATYPVKSSNCGSIGRRRGSSYKTSRDVSLDRATSRIARPKFSTYYQSYPRKSSSLMNLCGSSCDQDSLTYNSRYMTDTDSGLGLATPPHRTSSPAPNNSSPSGPGSLPPSHHSRRRYDDTASESGGSEYSGLRLYKQPAVKSNRGIIMNAIEYCVFPGEVNRGKKNRLMEEITRSDGTSTKHFLILFRDAGCQYRALYSYFPETEEVMKVSGIGPRLVTEDMFDKFFKYNSGGKCFAQVHTKHLTVTIDAFTIHNNLWQGKKVNLPNKRDMTLVI